MNERYTHLLPDDVALWSDYLATFPNQWKQIDYDVRVGDGRDPGSEYQDNIRHMAIQLSQRRIDAVGYTDRDITIIEISVAAGLTTLGQLSAYPHLFQSTYNPTLPLKLLLVCRRFQSDAQPAFDRLAIPYTLVPERT
jgi:hypothetical protein